MSISGSLAELIFNNFIPILIVVAIFYIASQIRKMSEYRKELQKRFDQVLTEYLNMKINFAKDVMNTILSEYGREDAVSTEINRLMIAIEKGASGDINDKVATSNAINKFRLSKNVDLDKYPSMVKMNDIGVFNETEMTSLDNGVALARKEYNTYAFRYNQVASGFPMQYLARFFGFKSHYVIFGNPKSTSYHANYETLDSIDENEQALSVLNGERTSTNSVAEEQNDKIEEEPEVLIEHSDVVLKPTQALNNLSENKNANQND